MQEPASGKPAVYLSTGCTVSKSPDGPVQSVENSPNTDCRPETVLAKNGNVTCFRSRMMAQAESTEEANFTDIILSCLVKDAQRNTVSRDNARILNEQVSRTLMEREEEKVRRQQAEAELAAKAKELELIKSQLVALQATSDSGVAAGAA